MYYISPSMRGEQPTIYLARPPLWFLGFLEDEDDMKQQVATNSVLGDAEEIDGKDRRKRSLEGKGSRKSRRDRPLMPGAVDPKEAEKRFHSFLSNF